MPTPMGCVRNRLAAAGCVSRLARIARGVLPMAAVAGAVLLLSSPPGGRLVRALDPLIDSWNGVGRSLSVYEPSRMEVVEAVVRLLRLGPDDVLVDIGSGDGRFVVAAARAGAQAVGIERRGDLVRQSRDNARMAGVASRAAFVHADALTLPSVVARATVVTVFLTPQGFEVLVPWLEAGVLSPGDRVVSHTWPVPGWRPEEVLLVGAGAETRPVYLYRFPAADPHAARAHRGDS